MHTIAHRIAVRTEEIILLRTLSNPPDSDDIKVWLLQCRTEIQAHLTAEGLIAERDAAREEVTKLQGWLGSNRWKKGFNVEQARREAEDEDLNLDDTPLCSSIQLSIADWVDSGEVM